MCAIFQDVSKNRTPLTKSILKMLSNIAADALKPCPYVGRSSLLNVDADSKLLSWVPKGIIRFVLKSSTDIDKSLLRLTLLISFEK